MRSHRPRTGDRNSNERAKRIRLAGGGGDRTSVSTPRSGSPPGTAAGASGLCVQALARHRRWWRDPPIGATLVRSARPLFGPRFLGRSPLVEAATRAVSLRSLEVGLLTNGFRPRGRPRLRRVGGGSIGDAFDSLHGPALIRTGVPSPARLLRRPGGPTGGELDPNRQDRTRMNLVKSAWPRSRRRRHDTSVQARGSFGAPNPSSCRVEPTRVTQLDDHSYPLEAPSFGEITFRGETQ